MLKSLLGNEMLYSSWVHVLHITYFNQQQLLEIISNHFDLFVINKDDSSYATLQLLLW